jgi:hypothetical protein
MSNFDSSLRECFGFSHIIISDSPSVFIALELISPRFPIGVETMYKPFFINTSLIFFILLASCAPVNNITKNKNEKTDIAASTEISVESSTEQENVKLEEKPSLIIPDQSLENNITIILSKKDSDEIVNQFINIIELAVYKKKIENISFSIKIYENKSELNDFLTNQNLAGKIFIGPINSSDSEILQQFCSKGAVFFSFSSTTTLAKNCVFLINFFPENELKTIFNFFPNNSKVALLYPENEYGFGINSIIDNVADQSNSIIINRASYNKDLTNAPQAIKELGKYELRKYELNRQKQILANKKDKESKRRLIKLEKFQTTKDLDFTHIIIADYGLRLLQVAPLLPYYDIDPNIVRFVGTGAWDDAVFYDEPSLSGSIYPGIELNNRQQLNDDYQNLYQERLLRISTLPYDLVGLLDYLINNDYKMLSLYKALQNNNIRFAGVDGNFYFSNNKIERDLQVLQIKDGQAKVVSK